jgi:hypothetical protein
MLLALAMSGLTLYYPPHEDWRNAFSTAHQMLGMSFALILPLHIVLARKGRRARLALSGHARALIKSK